MYIIDPFYIYLIEQLNTVNIIIMLFIITSLILIIIHIGNVLDNITSITYKMNSIKFDLNRLDKTSNKLNEHLHSISTVMHAEELSNALNNNNNSNQFASTKIELGVPKGEELEKIEKAIQGIKNYMDDYKDSISGLKQSIQTYEDHFILKLPSIKTCVIMFVISLAIFSIIPNKSSAYKIMIASMVTTDNVSKVGAITADTASTILDKITEAVIKIQNSK